MMNLLPECPDEDPELVSLPPNSAGDIGTSMDSLASVDELASAGTWRWCSGTTHSRVNIDASSQVSSSLQPGSKAYYLGVDMVG
jgi:hypothetical protein